MKKGTIWAIIIFIIIVSGLILFSRFQRKTHFNSDTTQGNTSGNLMNGGLFCEEDGHIYFSNEQDKGALYVMDSNLSNFKKLNNDKSAYINVAGKYIYYSRLNYEDSKKTINLLNFNSAGLYRINKNGNKVIQLYSEPSGAANLYGNYLYYQSLNNPPSLPVNRVKIDKSEEKQITKDTVSPISIDDNTLYYSDTEKNHYIYSMDLSTSRLTTILEDNTYHTVVNNGYLYYLSLSNDYAIARVNLDGSNPTILVNERCSTFNISENGDYLYYQVDDTKNNRICKLNIQTKESTTILSGDYKQIHVTTDYVFFKTFDNKQTFYISVDGHVLNSFTPKVIKDK